MNCHIAMEEGRAIQPCEAKDLNTSPTKNPRVETTCVNSGVSAHSQTCEAETPVTSKERTLLKMECGSFYMPKKDKGDDAHFIRAKGNIIGVTDGIAGTRKDGVDSGVYARKLMENAAKEVASASHSNYSFDDLRMILNEAYVNTNDIKGSTTTCMVALSNDVKGGKLHAINVGNSGFMLFRKNKLIFKSGAQVHRFNCPFRLSRNQAKHGSQCAEEIGPIGVMHGDVVVLGTDGLLDNVWPIEIEQVLDMMIVDGVVEPNQLASTIVKKLALWNSRDVNKLSPFAIAARKIGRERIGGKIDDITAVVGHIVAT